MNGCKSRHNADVAAHCWTQAVVSLAAGGLLLGSAGAVLGSSRAPAGGSIRSATTPPSSYQSGLVERPNPVDNNGNLLITGNVAGGKYFHGGVPYRSTTSIDAPLGSTSLDSFLRYTEPVDFGGSLAGYSPFYSPTGTVTTLQPGRSSIFAPVKPRAGQTALSSGDTTTDLLYPAGSAAAQTSAGIDSEAGLLSFSTGARLCSSALPITSNDVPPGQTQTEKTIDRPPLPGSEEYQRQLQELQRRFGLIQAGADDLARSLSAEDGGQRTEDGERQPAPSMVPRLAASEMQPSVNDSLARRQELLQETARLLSTTTELPHDTTEDGRQGTQDGAQGPTVLPEPSNAIRPPSIGLRLYDPQRDSRLTVEAVLSVGRVGSPPTRPDLLDLEGRVGQEPILYTRSQPARDEYLESQRRATAPGVPTHDVGTRANDHSPLPRPDVTSVPQADPTSVGANNHSPSPISASDPNAARLHLSKSQTQFAAGQFAACAQSLVKAIELDPKHALQRVDLVWTSGGPEKFIACFNDLAQRARADHAPELQLLLAYIYYQMERPGEARTAIDAARRGLPSSRAAEILSSAIEQ